MELLAATALTVSTGLLTGMFWLIARLPDAALRK